MKHWEGSWKYDAQQSIFDELRGISSGDETLCWKLDIVLLLKQKGEIKDAKMSSFPSDFQTAIKN